MDSLQPLKFFVVGKQMMTPDIALFRFLMNDTRAEGPNGGNHKPGQFVMLSVHGVGEAPFSICHDAEDHPLELCIANVGTLTNKLFNMPGGSVVALRGPYGRPFPVERMEGHDILMIAGGIGMAPIRGLMHHVIKNRDKFGRVMLCYGMRDENNFLFKDELLELQEKPDKVEVFLSADCASDRCNINLRQGNVGHLIDSISLNPGGTMVAVCGPPVMYSPVEALLRKKGLYPQNLFFSLERRMACGIGQCGHCAIGYRYTCLDGPVFSSWEARGLKEAWEHKHA